MRRSERGVVDIGLQRAAQPAGDDVDMFRIERGQAGDAAQHVEADDFRCDQRRALLPATSARFRLRRSRHELADECGRREAGERQSAGQPGAGLEERPECQPGDRRQELDGDQLLRQADQAMYRAKQQGRNRYVRFSEDTFQVSSSGTSEGNPQVAD